MLEASARLLDAIEKGESELRPLQGKVHDALAAVVKAWRDLSRERRVARHRAAVEEAQIEIMLRLGLDVLSCALREPAGGLAAGIAATHQPRSRQRCDLVSDGEQGSRPYLIAQNITGILIALGFGANPYYGLLIGSISFVGGPGTAAAWAKEAQAAGLEHASEVAVAGATLAVVVGAVVAGPITGWLVQRHKLKATGVPGRRAPVPRRTRRRPSQTPRTRAHRSSIEP